MVRIVQHGKLQVNYLSIKLSTFPPLTEIRPIFHACLPYPPFELSRTVDIQQYIACQSNCRKPNPLSVRVRGVAWQAAEVFYGRPMTATNSHPHLLPRCSAAHAQNGCTRSSQEDPDKRSTFNGTSWVMNYWSLVFLISFVNGWVGFLVRCSSSC